MTVELKSLQLIPRTIQAVKLTEDNLQEVADWVQSKLAFQEVKVTKDGRLLLPSVGQYVDMLEAGDWVFYDPQDNSFRGAEDDAVNGYYMEVPDGDGSRSV